MRTNLALKPVYTHEGAKAVRLDPERQLRRSVMACMLWEDTFYEDGKSIVDRISNLIPQCRPEYVAACAFEARGRMKLRHVPLLICREMLKHAPTKPLVGRLLADVIQRPDEITEFLALYWQQGKRPLAAQVKKALAKAFLKFDEYAFAKYDRDAAVKLRDALFLCHAKPQTKEQEVLFKKIVDRKLTIPDTWEVALSGGADKKETFERLMAEKKLGALAFIRNLRNMKEAGVDKSKVLAYAEVVNLDRILPFRFVAAARAVPGWSDICDAMLFRVCAQQAKLQGKTIIVVDVSGSMYASGNVSKHSDMSRVEAAGALAAVVRESCADARLYATAGNDGVCIHATAECPAYRGMSLVETFTEQGYGRTLGGGGIFLVQCLAWIKERERNADRIIVLTDEQDCDNKLAPAQADAFGKHNYLINVSVNRNGIGYKPKWTHIDGWSEAVIDYIREAEAD